MRFPSLSRALKRPILRLISAGREIYLWLGFDLYLRTDDRRVLESIILPFFAREAGVRRVLFVGCHWYTRGYRRWFSKKEYWTLDRDPEQRQFGSKRHIVDSLENLADHFRRNELDLILCNGVLGWGLNEKERAETAFRACFECLRPEGVFVLGWNDLPHMAPLAIEQFDSLRLFRPYVFPPLGASRYLTACDRHTYAFYIK